MGDLIHMLYPVVCLERKKYIILPMYSNTFNEAIVVINSC